MGGFQFTIQRVGDTLFEGAYVGHLGEEDVAVLDQTDRLFGAVTGRVDLVYDLSQMTGFHRSQVGRHGSLFFGHRDKITGIALIGVKLATIRFGAITVATLARIPIKTFDTRPEAMAWLKTLRAKPGEQPRR
jgi:hypothetical protein